MRIAIAGAGSVGRSVAGELLRNGHDVLLVDRAPKAVALAGLERAQWLLADCCELDQLREARLETADVLVAATGDDKANLVVSLLARTEFRVGRTVARVNNPANEWMFDATWGVDVAVSTPRLMTALVERAVEVGDVVRLLSFYDSAAGLVGFTLPAGSPLDGVAVADVPWPRETVLACVLRGRAPLPPGPGVVLAGGDELLLVTVAEAEAELEAVLSGRPGGRGGPDGTGR